MVPPHLDMKLLLKMSVNLGLDGLAIEIEKMTKPSLGDWIKLDVGGKIFNISRTTLTQDPDSLLGRMFDPDSRLPPAKMEDGAFLIDAAPSSFPVILHWLRCREVSLGEVTVNTALSTAKYFGLQGLVKALELQGYISKKKTANPPKPLNPELDWIKLSADGTIFDSTRATLIRYSGSLLAKMFDPRRDDYCPPPRDSNGAYLIDCNPQIFSVFREMLRSNDFERCSGITKENFKAVDTACQRFIGLSLKRLDFFD